MAEGERRKGPARWLLIAPLALALLLGLGLTAFWWTAKQRVEQQLDQLAAADAGISWQSRRVSGWPFRLKVTLVEPRLRGPGQLAFGAPELTAQAYLYRLDHWNAAAPRGLTLIRPEGGPVAITGRAIRASVTDASSAPRFDMQGLNLTFRPAPGARPFSLASAERMEVHWRPRPGAPQEAAFYVSLDGGKAAPATFADFMARGAPIAFVWDARVSHADTFDGATWPQAARAWAEAGGQMRLQEARLSAGEVAATSRTGQLTVAPDGRLRGTIDIDVTRAPVALSALARTEFVDDAAAGVASTVAQAREDRERRARVAVTFQAGVTTVGPIPIGPAPKLF